MEILTSGERILLNRKRLGLTKSELAKRIKIDVSQIKRYEYDEEKPDTEKLAMLAQQFGKSVDELVYGV